MQRIKPSEKLKYFNLLYVEDNEGIREAFVMIIQRYVKNLFVATNGKEGLEIFKNNHIDLILSDIKMPVMDGLEMAREIRKLNLETPLVFMTAFGDSQFLKDAIDVGADGYLIKPIDRNKLFEKLNKIASNLYLKKEVKSYFELIEVLFNLQQNGVVLVDDNHNIKLMNKTFREFLKTENIENYEKLDLILQNFVDENNKPLNIENMLNLDKTSIICRCESKNIYFDIDVVRHNDYYIINFYDVTKYKIENEVLKEKSMIDELTQIYNRKKLDAMKDKLIDTNICVIMFDIDHFKTINDTYGHLKGDEVLKILVKVIKENIRSEDVFIRWGGEEFIIILKNLNDIEIAKKLAEKLRKAISETEVYQVGHFSCSFGVACDFIDSLNDIELIINEADKALYLAKNNGRNRVEVY